MPLAVLVAVAALNLWHASGTAHRRAAAAERVELSVAATTAARQLAQERGLSASTLTDGTGGPAAPDELAFQRGQTSEAVDALQTVIAQDAGQPATGPALDSLRRLGPARQEVDRGLTSTDAVLGTYAEIIDPVLELGPAPDAGGDAALATGLSAFNALSRGIQEVALEQSLVSSVLAAGTIDAGTYQRLLGSVSNQGLWFDLFQRTATPAQLDSYGDVQALPSMATAQNVRDTALAAGPGGPVEGSAELWSNAMGRKVDLLDAMADASATDLAGTAAAHSHGAAGHRTMALALLVVAVLFAAALVALLDRLGGSRLRQLAGATHRAATETVPETVEIAQVEGAEAARRALRPMPRAGATELDEIAAAVDSLQDTAVGLAAEGAVLRGNVHSVFLNFGTRTQNLVTRQLGHIDDLEARTDDPDTLSDLFLLDHLATRLRRNAESLVVMAGAESPRPWARPVSVVNVVRAAAAEATDYSRVDVEHMAPAAVLGAVANDVSHLLAELLDNGIAFSPPEARIVVAGGWHHDGRYLISVSDAGMGMSDAQLTEANDRIAELPVSESDMSGFFGLFVVGRFARRHGIEVQLVPSAADGVTAEVLLPDTVLGTHAGAGAGVAATAESPAATTMMPAITVPEPAAERLPIRPAPPIPSGTRDGGSDGGSVGSTGAPRAQAPGRPPLRPAPPIPPLVSVPTDADRRSDETGDHTAQPRWLRRRMRRPAGTRDNVTPPVATDPAASPTMAGRGDD
ncbi:MAG TPA: ATP-binding protein [Acidimicrobiales bacterium]|nr:ATP-binding protein [Acidimicrobiales bacterium]